MSGRSAKKHRDRSYPPVPEELVVPVYDNHTHIDPSIIDDFPVDGPSLTPAEQLDRASAAGVRGIVQVGTDVASSRWSAEAASTEPRMLAAVAIHPNEAPVLDAAGTLDDGLAAIAELASRPRVRCIGETGLDYFRTEEDGREAQLRSFEAHIEIAKQNDLALQIHDRDAHDDVVATLKRVGAPERTVFHCFSGDTELAEICTENGWYMSFAGTATFKNARNLRRALDVAPRALVLVETDAPFLTPMPYRGRPNASYLLPHTVRFIAQHLETDVTMLAAQILSNTEYVYGRWDTDPVVAPGDPYAAGPQ
ncbi:TatD family hydrolase [Paramicrobacterium agarici]|uniref:TatD DNase family protein n=1 Tax=Paramicrobacterium agarici TaxID=630514 RepID=A0A2A9E0X8_9MICO|nr:TatD family hydrolase [Microbacterium agarici]PFG31830.1 TatD DNase family protein [Microbacterium agarici]